jgi:two-component system OmpR family sensor kinase/two-component system sensor histidine kinase RstB
MILILNKLRSVQLRLSSSGKSFFSLYFLIIATFIIFSWLLDNVWTKYIKQDIESYTGYKTMLMAVGDYVSDKPEEEWQEIIEKTANRYQLTLTLTSLSELEKLVKADHYQLKQSDVHIYYLDDVVELHYFIPSSDKVIHLGPVETPTRPKIKSIYRIVIYGVFGVIILIWLWPMSRDLDQLQKATKSFGNGKFSTKVGEAKSSMIQPLMMSFNMMSTKIKDLIDAQKELTNAVSHELRTPLARSKFALQMLSSVKDEEKREKYQQQIKNDVLELEALINEMLLYASFESEKPDLLWEKHSVKDLVAYQIESHQAFNHQIEFINNAPSLEVTCDRHFIDRALSNLISNAIKYGNDKVRITVSEILIKNTPYCCICVEDNGEGVSEHFKEVIFDAFSRGDQSRNRETGGFGLGLAIVARILEWHQGSTSLSDSDLGGAKFKLYWPLKQKEHQ